MSLASKSVNHGITTLMAYLTAIGFGFFSLSRLGLDMYPDVTFPLVGIITTYEGAGPEDIEELITRRIEEAASSVKGVTEINSTSKQGASVVFVEFEWGSDVEQGELDLRKSLEFYKDLLPPDAKNPMTFAFNPSMQPIMFILVTGNYDQAQLRRISEHSIEPRMERVPGVAAVDTMGGLQREIQVRVLPERLRAYRVSVQQVIDTLRRENLQIPAGSLEQGGQEFTILSEGQFRSVDDIRNVVVSYRQAGMATGPTGQPQATLATRLVPVRVRDVANVEDTFHEASRVVTANGEDAVFLVVRKQSGQNTVRAAQGVVASLPDIQKLLPDLKFQVLFDQSEFISQSLGNLANTGYQALFFTFVVLLVFLVSLRASLVVAISIPVSVIVTFAAMDQIGLTLNILSMAGLMLAIGMLVDNSIVVLENIVRLVDGGMDPKAAAQQGATEVSMAVTASTLTTIAVFAPIPFVPGIAGLLFRDMAWTIVVSLTASLVVALTLVPVLAYWMLSRRRASARIPFYQRWILGAINGARDGYTWMLRGVLRFRKTAVLVTLLLFVASIKFGMTGRGFDFFPKSDQGVSILQVSTAVGTSLEETEKRVRALEETIRREIPEVAFVAVDLGVGEGFTAIFGKGAHAGLIRVKYKPLAERTRRQAELEADILERAKKIPGLEVNLYAFAAMGSGADIELELYGEDLELAREIGVDLKRRIEDIPGTADVTFSLDEGKPEYRIQLDRDRMAALGVPSLSVTNTVQSYFQGVIASRYREEGYDYNILVRSPRERRLSADELRQLPVATLTGRQIPLSEVAKVVRAVGPAEVTRKNQRRLVTIQTNVSGRDLGGVMNDVEKLMRDYRLPPEFSWYLGGTAEDLRDTQKYMFIALLVAMLLVYMVMASQFESLLEPFIIFFTLPMGVIGIGLAFWLTGMTISVPAIIGIVILVGVVVNNGIVLVDRANQSHRDDKKPLLESCIEAGRLRFRPVLMTALTTILGMVPLAAEIGEGSENWAPMAKVLIGGLSAATLLTLFLVPALYLMIVGFVERFREFGMIRLVPKYLVFWAVLAAGGAAAAVVLSQKGLAPASVTDALPAIVAGAVLLIGLCVTSALGIRKRRRWAWGLGLGTFTVLFLAGLAAAAAAARWAGATAEAAAAAGLAVAILSLPVIVPLVRRRHEFGIGSPPTPTQPPPEPTPPEDPAPPASGDGEPAPPETQAG